VKKMDKSKKVSKRNYFRIKQRKYRPEKEKK
jgi:hypothetical protein